MRRAGPDVLHVDGLGRLDCGYAVFCVRDMLLI